MKPADLSLVKDTSNTPEDTDNPGTQENPEESRTFADRLPGLAVAGGYVAAGLVVFLVGNIAVGLLLALHGLHLATWILLIVYCFLGGGLARAAKEQERVLKTVTLHWASYQAWAADGLPQRWETLLAHGCTARGWVWKEENETS
ncbi:hypothetical protein ACN6LF_001382 [[Kitasatospora] papulosa]|uniref:hypothetical protein n=1 Tax=[Kitasatospora] papulosa TaxID=1464011 RepID=UPI00403C7356